MAVTRSLCKIPALMAVLIFFACVLIGTWGFVHAVSPKIDAALDRIASAYDRYLPRITIRNGRAGIDEKQPYVVTSLKKKGTLVVIDTRPGKEKEALNYLKRVRRGAVLTRESLVMKKPGQIRVFTLKDLPDLVFDSKSLREMKSRYFPAAVKIGAVLIGFYFFAAKILQILLFALIPYFGAWLSKDEVTYGRALKVATAAMVPPVVLDLFLGSPAMGLRLYLWPYFALYLALLIAAALDLAKGAARPQTDISSPINP